MTMRILDNENKNVIRETKLVNKKNENEFEKNEANSYLAVMWQRRSRMQCLSI